MIRFCIYLLFIPLAIMLAGCAPEAPQGPPPPGEVSSNRVALGDAWAGWAVLSSDGNYLVYAGGADAKSAAVYCYDVANAQPYRKVSPEGVTGCRYIKIANPSAIIAYIAGENFNASVREDSYFGGTPRLVDSGGYAGDLFFGYGTKRICWLGQKPQEELRNIRYTATTLSDIAQWEKRPYDVLHPSPDLSGSTVTYMLANPSAPELHIADYGGSNDRVLDTVALEYGNATFSPDGKYIVFAAKYAGTNATDLYRITPEGKERTALTRFDVIGKVAQPVVSPDGNYVYFLFSSASVPGRSGLWRVAIAGGQAEQVAVANANPEMPLTMNANGSKAAFSVGDNNKSEVWLVTIKNPPMVE
jgi:hypothetical protein